MKYSIRGTLNTTDEAGVISAINNYEIWRLTTYRGSRAYDENPIDGDSKLIFEVWVNSLSDKDSLFNDLKTFVDDYGEIIDWHECTHDESNPLPCVIAEEYRG